MQRTHVLLACTLLLVAAGIVAGLVALAVAKEEDSTPPVISYVSATLLAHDVAVITWTTDEPATTIFSYRCATSSWIAGPSEYSPIAYPLDEPLFSTSHSVCLGYGWNSLEPDTTYTYTVTSVDRAGNEAVSDEYTFTTLPSP